MSDPYRNADDPLGVAFDVMVPCQQRGPGVVDFHACKDCDNSGLIPNPAITQECGTCGGSGDVAAADEPSPIPCHSCEGRGWTFRSSVRVAERVEVVEVVDWRLLQPRILEPRLGRVWLVYPKHQSQDITHLFREPCPECGGAPCVKCHNSGTIRSLPKPGELWEIGWREAELVPVVDSLHNPLPHIFVKTGPLDRMVWFRRISPLGVAQTTDISHHFPTPPKPGQRAGVFGELVLADEARKVE